jgi:ATP-binding cassette subfamily C protein
VSSNDRGANGFRLVVEDGAAAKFRGTDSVHDAEVIRLGRSDDADVVIAHQTVSRKHAEIRRTPSGYLLVDQGSANGVWVNDTRVQEHALENGQSFRLGHVRLRFELVQQPAEEPAPARPSPAPEPPPAPPPPQPTPAAPKPSAEATPPAEPPPQPAPPEPTPAADAKPKAAPEAAAEPPLQPPSAEAPQQPPPAETAPAPPEATAPAPQKEAPQEPPPTAEPKPAAAPEEKAPPAAAEAEEKAPAEPAPQEVEPAPIEAMPPPPAPRTEPPPAEVTDLAEVFKLEGTEVRATGNKPFVLDGEQNIWFVESGKVELFTVALKANRPHGGRSHFITIEPGQLMCGMDLEGFAMGSGFLAVGSMGTVLRHLDVARLQKLSADERFRDQIADMIDGWVANLSHSLTAEIIPGPLVDMNLEEEGSTSLPNQQKARSNRDILWLEATDGNLLFIGMEELVFSTEGGTQNQVHKSVVMNLDSLFEMAQLSVDRENLLFPLSPDTWIEATNQGDRPTELSVHRASSVVGDGALWLGLQFFHKVLCQCEFINKKLAAVDEFNRLKTKAEYSEAARVGAYREIAGVLEQPTTARMAIPAAAEEDPVLAAARLVGDAIGVEVQPHPDTDPRAGFEPQVMGIAKASRIRLRQVALRDDWWNHDHGPILARLDETEDPVALIPKSSRSYQFFDPKSGASGAVNEQLASTLHPFGYVFYRVFPDGAQSAIDLIKFGVRGLVPDLWTLVAMGIGVGLLGALTPFFTGKLFDTAIPEAERGLVFQYTVALFIGALVSAAFKITQSIAVVRIQGKMDYSLQSAVWDRLLNLPSTFFRDYSSGDLAERAAGVNDIRDMISGAGVSSILGSLSSVFYVVLMFKYDMKMALLAMLLTAIFVSVTFTANYMQLRHQRSMLWLQGKITGLVLQLVGGVGKLRVSGAENHSFRIWARDYSSQRRLEFKIGRIQNVVEVFNSAFPVISSMTIFFALVKLMEAAGKAGTPPPLTTGEFVAFTSAYTAFQTAMQSLSEASLQMLKIVPTYERLRPIITTEAETDESRAHPGTLKGEIEVAHASFRYTEDGPLILDDMTLTIEPGEFVAFVGGSGCGKSTMMRLMLGFEVPERGSVYYDGQDLASLDLREVRTQIGVVLQNSQLLPADIFRNIVGTSSLTIEDAWDAARLAGLDADIEDMPMGMHTYVSEGGGGLSGGQRQRLMIARSLVRKPRILFFDEATSALDNRSQAQVTESMERLQATRIVIAHRLSTIINADRICYLEKGKVAEMGSYEELMELDGLFAQLAKRQMA